MWDWIFFVIVDFLIIYSIYFYFYKLKNLASKNKEIARKFGGNLVIGIVAGVIVLIVDRGINIELQNAPKIEFTLILPFLKSLLSLILISIFEGGSIFLLIFFVAYHSFKHYAKKK